MRIYRRSPLAFSIKEFRPARGATLSSQIVTYIRDALFAGDLTPGDVLGSEGDLAKQFGVSRMSIRDALRSLEAMGIVDIKLGSKGGAAIADGSSDRFAAALAIQLVLIGVTKEDVLQARAVIERFAAGLAARNAGEEQLERMRGLLDEAEANLDNPEETARLGEAFHIAVAEAAGNDVLVAQLKAFRDAFWTPPRLPDRSTAEYALRVHRDVFETIEAGDYKTAAELMAEHLGDMLEKRFPDSAGST